jgi:hypothetical protein
MAATKLDGPGTQKMKTLEEVMIGLQGLHGIVERMAMDMKVQKPVGVLVMQIKRMASPLQGQLKGQFSIIADQVSAMILAAGRGGSDAVRLRTMREHVGQIRTALEVAMQKVKEQHSVDIESSGG